MLWVNWEASARDPLAVCQETRVIKRWPHRVINFSLIYIAANHNNSHLKGNITIIKENKAFGGREGGQCWQM